MENVDQYRKHIQDILHELGDESEYTRLIFDKERDHYQLLSVGWQNERKRVLDIIAHIDILDGKIWIQRDFTEPSITEQLQERGVPTSDIVLGFQPPYKRRFAEFATA